MSKFARSLGVALGVSVLALASGLAMTPIAHAEPAAQKLALERLYTQPSLSGSGTTGVKLSPDGKVLTFLKPRADDRNVLDLWAVNLEGGEPYRLIDANALSNASKELSEAEKATRERARISNRGVVQYYWDEQAQKILVPLDGDVYVFDRASQKVSRLTETAADEVDSKLSPKGAYVSYVRDLNLYIKPVNGGAEKAITTEGKDAISFGTAEYMNQEEFNRFTGYWWSPTETHIAFTRVDENGVDIIPRLEYQNGITKTVDQRYPRAGRPNAKVDLFVENLSTGKRVQVDLGANADTYLVRVNWSADGKTLYVQRLSRNQQTLDLLATDIETGKTKTVLTQKSNTWIDVTYDFHPLKDGTLLWSHEDSGYRHIYHYGADGKLLNTVTSGNWPVARIEGLDEKSGQVLFSASKEDNLQSHLYTVSYKRKDEPKKLTSGEGWWSASVAKSGTAFVGNYSDPKTPPRTGLYDAKGKLVRWIDENKLDDKHPYAAYVANHPVPEYGTLKASDGQTLYYSITKPADFDPKKKYPVIVSLYGGPTVQTVKKSWQPLTDRLLTENGYIVFKLDNRDSSNRDVKFHTALFHKMGTVEVEDHIQGANFLKTLPYVDGDNIGVTGWSYGGFMILSLMATPNTPFKAAAGGAAPTDWSLYDTAYTERYMGTPQENPQGYANSDVVKKVSNIKPFSLLYMHGMADDNVIFANGSRVIAELQAKGIPFEMQLYPGERHGVRPQAKSMQQWKLYLDFFNRKLKSHEASK